MKRYKQTSILIAAIMLCVMPGVLGYRSIHRIKDPQITELHARWVNGNDHNKDYVLRTDTCERSAIFDVFDHQHFMNNIIPQGPITFRNDPDKSVPGATLHNQLMGFLDEIKNAHEIKNEYTHFKMLKKTNFTAKNGGLIIMKFKDFPFVVKLYRETPETFTHPRLHDFEQRCLFHIAGGISRYLIGFTRIKNLTYIKERVEQDPHWSKILDMPRKWFWLPDNARWFEVTCEHINGTTHKRTVLPSTYAVIADAIEAEHVFEMKSKEDRELILSLTNWLGGDLDPNIPNYMREKGTGKTVFIDTEHFPTDIGLREPMHNDTFFSWYMKLARKFFNDAYFRNKRARLALRNGTYPCIMPCHEHADKDAVSRTPSTTR